MRLLCPRCAAAIPARSVNVERLVAKCEACGEVFRLEPDFATGTAVEWLPRPKAVEVRGELPGEPQPDGTYRDLPPAAGEPTVLSFRWFGPSAWFLLVFALAWNATIVLMVANLVAVGLPLLALVCGAFLGLGVAMLYGTWVFFVNRTEIIVGPRTVRVQHVPVRFFHHPEVEIARIRRVFVQERTFQHEDGRSHQLVLCADVDGVPTDLVRGLRDRQVAAYLAQIVGACVASRQRARP